MAIFKVEIEVLKIFQSYKINKKMYLPETLQILRVESFSVAVKNPPGIPLIHANAEISVKIKNKVFLGLNKEKTCCNFLKSLQKSHFF